MSDRKGYNGLRGPVAFGGQVHDLSGVRQRNEQEVLRQAFSAQMQALMREMYVRAVADSLRDEIDGEAADHWRAIAQQCQVAAMCYFEGLGLIQKPPEEPQPTEHAD